MFKKARLSLTGWYVLILMTISVGLSIAIYTIQVREINRVEAAYRTHIEQRMRVMRGFGLMQKIVIDEAVLDEARRRILYFLVLMNGGILVASAGLAYMLAGNTLRPIQTMVDSQDRFVSDASHELRTPLTALKSSFEVFLRGRRPSAVKAKQVIVDGLEEVDRLEKMIQGLLMSAKRSYSSDLRNMELISMKGVIEQAQKRVWAKAVKAKVEIKSELVDFVVYGDESRLISLMTILLDNAVKYSHKNSIVNVTTLVNKSEGMVMVSDVGLGISQDDLPHIFDRFYRADTARTRKGDDGYGLGLSIAKEIVDEHGAKIEIESEAGKGTTARVIIELANL